MTRVPLMMSAGPDAFALIKHFEGLRLVAYRDFARGVWTIGWGHTGPRAEGPRVITLEEAERMLQDDVEYARRKLNQLLIAQVKQHEFDALLSWMFHYGETKAKSSTLLRLVNFGEMQEAASELLKWNKAHINGRFVSVRGLTRRRQVERELFLRGKLVI